MRKSLIALAVTLTITAGALAAHAAIQTYTDVSGNWAQTDINTATSMNLMTGFNDGMFHPDAWVTRTEYAKMVMKTLGLPYNKISEVPSVNSVAKNDWGFGTIDNQAWISTYPQGVFRPENPVRRAEALAALAGTLNKPLVSDDEANQILSQYADAAQIPAGGRRAVATAIKYNLFEVDPRYGNMILPLQPATRADVAALLVDLYENRDITIAANMAPVQTSSVITTTTIPTSGTVTALRDSSGNGIVQKSAKNAWLYGSIPYRSGADTISELKPVIPGKVEPSNEPISQLNLPPNTVFTGTVAKAVYSEYNRPGDPFMLILDHALFDANNQVVAPAGSKLLGYISCLQSRNPSDLPAQMGITFTQIVTPTGKRLNMTGAVAAADGLIKADAPQGVTFHPEHSVAALKREINTAEGGWYNLKQGKMWVLDEPMTSQITGKALDPDDKRNTDIVIGVGDRLQVRIGEGCCPQPVQ